MTWSEARLSGFHLPWFRAASVRSPRRFLAINPIHARILDILFAPGSVDGIYNLGLWVEPFLRDAGFRLVDHSFGARDFFIKAAIVAQKPEGCN